MAQSDKLYIIGFMGSGKTTVGGKLANLLGWKFVDLDKLIEKDASQSIPEIFASRGESGFREIESRILRSLENEKNLVVSTGGGAPCHSGNMDFMIRTGLTIYLKLTPGQLKSRISGTGNARPLIKDLDDKELLNFIEEKLTEREKWYSLARFIISGFDADASEIYSSLRSELEA